MNIGPAASFEAVIDTGEPGLTGTITVEGNDNTGTTTIPATTAGIVEIAAGVYAATGLTAPGTAGQYTLIWKNAGEVLGVEDLVVTGSAPGDPVPPAEVYGTVDEMFRRLKIRPPTTDQTAAAERMLAMASGEVNAWMGRTTGLAAWELQLVTEVTLDRAVELWSEDEVPFGAIALDNPAGPVFLPRNSRALARLMPVKETFGVA